MSTTEPGSAKASTPASVPRWLALLVGSPIWAALLTVVHGVIPWAVSTLTHRLGWVEGQPSVWNLAGLGLVAAGLSCILWVLVLHVLRTPERVDLELTPKYLLRRGPYAFSRNPMFLGVLVLWLGWAWFYGSIPVCIGCLGCGLVMRRAVAWEERKLEARFGETYRQYKQAAPRWLGRPRR
jgi:protein-S-isoprenylcysteine O-methyltransferase Ste14